MITLVADIDDVEVQRESPSTLSTFACSSVVGPESAHVDDARSQVTCSGTDILTGCSSVMQVIMANLFKLYPFKLIRGLRGPKHTSVPEIRSC